MDILAWFWWFLATSLGLLWSKVILLAQQEIEAVLVAGALRDEAIAAVRQRFLSGIRRQRGYSHSELVKVTFSFRAGDAA